MLYHIDPVSQQDIHGGIEAALPDTYRMLKIGDVIKTSNKLYRVIGCQPYNRIQPPTCNSEVSYYMEELTVTSIERQIQPIYGGWTRDGAPIAHQFGATTYTFTDGSMVCDFTNAGRIKWLEED